VTPAVRADLILKITGLLRHVIEPLKSEPHRTAWLLRNGFNILDPKVLNAAQRLVKSRLHDFIPTPRDVVLALLASPWGPRGGWSVFDPCAGEGAILRVLAERGWADRWACEIRAEERESLVSVAGDHHVVIGDWFKVRDQLTPDPRTALITNVPFSMIPSFPEACLGIADYTALLMPIEEMAGKQSTADFFREHPPTDLVPIPWRPFPHVRGVAWYIWRAGVEPMRIHVPTRSKR